MIHDLMDGWMDGLTNQVYEKRLIDGLDRLTTLVDLCWEVKAIEDNEVMERENTCYLYSTHHISVCVFIS